MNRQSNGEKFPGQDTEMVQDTGRASFRQKEERVRGAEREINLPEIQKAKLQRQHCRQNDAQAAEPGADSTFMIVTLLFVIVSGEGGK